MFDIRLISNDEFHQNCHAVMGHAFEVQNTAGTFLKEKNYQLALANLMLASGMLVQREAEIVVSHRDFTKSYFLDFVVNEGLITELKVTASLAPEHIGQVLNYLFLTNRRDALLINMRTNGTEKRFVSTSLTESDRKRYSVNRQRWEIVSDHCERLRVTLFELIEDWGTHLDRGLYFEALRHFVAAESRDIPLQGKLGNIGTVEIPLLDPNTGFAFSMVGDGLKSYEASLQKFLDLTPLYNLQWANLFREELRLTTLTRTQQSKFSR